MLGACGLWQFVKTYEGWAMSTGRMSDGPAPPTPEEYRDMVDASKKLNW